VFKELFGNELIPLNETILHPYTIANAILISYWSYNYAASTPKSEKQMRIWMLLLQHPGAC
jgi:short subunit fatty acids transporter